MFNILKKWRYDMFPDIQDWSASQDHLREAHPNDLSFYEFLWFHPYAYTFLKVGTPCIFMSMALIIALKNAKYGLLSLPLIIPAVLVILCLIWLFKEIRRLDVNLQTNLYDILMKD